MSLCDQELLDILRQTQGPIHSNKEPGFSVERCPYDCDQEMLDILRQTQGGPQVERHSCYICSKRGKHLNMVVNQLSCVLARINIDDISSSNDTDVIEDILDDQMASSIAVEMHQ